MEIGTMVLDTMRRVLRLFHYETMTIVLEQSSNLARECWRVNKMLFTPSL